MKEQVDIVNYVPACYLDTMTNSLYFGPVNRIPLKETLKGDAMDTAGVSKYLQLRHVTLHYLDYGGSGPCSLIMLHGGGANVHWFDWVGPLLARHCRVLSLDLRGHGDSSPAEPPVYTYDAYISDVRALVETEHIANPVLMGHSLGGMLVVKYTGTWPQEVGALVVCDAMLVYSPEMVGRLRRIGRRAAREHATLDDYIAHFRIRPDGLRVSQEVHDYIARHSGRQLANGRWIHKVDRHVFAQRETIDTQPHWRHITCPALFLRPEHGPRFVSVMLKRIKEACPHVECKEVAAAGHNLMLDQPEQTVALVVEFLQRHHVLQGL